MVEVDTLHLVHGLQHFWREEPAHLGLAVFVGEPARSNPVQIVRTCSQVFTFFGQMSAYMSGPCMTR